MRGRFCRLQLMLVLASAVILGSESHGTHDHRILLSQIGDSPSLEGQVRVFISPRKRMVQLYSEALGSVFVTSYDSQACGGNIRTRLHAGAFNQSCLNFRVRVSVRVTLRLAVYRQSIRLQSQIESLLRPTVSRSVSLGVNPQLGPKTRFLLLSHSCRFVDVGRPL
jgi:hypothetical protein